MNQTQELYLNRSCVSRSTIANESAMQARLKLVSILTKHEVFDYIARDFSTKEKAQKLAGGPLQELIDEKLKYGIKKKY